MSDLLSVGDWMKREVVSVRSSTRVKAAAALLVERRVGTLPVVDAAGVLIGMTSMTDITEIFLPDFVSLLANIDFVKEYGALETLSSEDLAQAETMLVADIMKAPVAVEEDCSLIRALSVMEKHNLQDLPVVKEGKLVGITSWVDIGRAFLTTWVEK